MILNRHIIKAVLSEYGAVWAFNRVLYSTKLKMMGLIPLFENVFEKKTDYPERLDLFKIDTDNLKRFICEKLSEENKKQLIEAADNACIGIIKGFNSIELNYGYPIDWQLNPLTGDRCDEKVKWYKIPDFDENRGDIKVTWEASRFSHFITIVRAYLLTDDKKYYKAFSEQLKHWVKSNPYSYGANFKCGQECSLRMINTLLAFSIFKSEGLIKDEDENAVKELVNCCYKKVLSNFFYAYRCIRNNHTISELMGMIAGAWCCNDEKQLATAYRLLDEVIEEQFMSDGGYRQFSFNYHRLALQDIECILSMSAQTGKNINTQSRERIKNSALLMYQCQDVSCDVPNYGSNDGALIFPVTSCGYRDFRSTVNTAYALITGRQLYEDDIHQEELIWFSREKNLQEYPLETIDRVSSQFREAGLFTIRGKSDWAMVVLNEYTSRPAHMDQLHLDLWVEGLNVLCDAGTYSYAGDKGRQLSQNKSHNTAIAESVSQMNLHGHFMIYDWTERQLGNCGENIFEGRCNSKNGYSHSRRIAKNGDVYTITDEIDTDGKLLFHTVCDAEVIDNKAILSKNGRALCEISSDSEIKLREAQRSIYYFRLEKTKCLEIAVRKKKIIKTEIKILRGEKND